MKKKKTLSTQLTLVISFIVLLIVGVFWMANNTLLEKYYVFNKEKEMLAVYKMVDLAAKNDKLSDDTFAVAFEKKCVGANTVRSSLREPLTIRKYSSCFWRRACRRIRQTTTT